MKKVILTIVAAVYIITCSAQKISYGVTAGIGLASMFMADVPKEIFYTWMYAPVPSYNLNAFVSWRVSGLLGINIEPGYIKKGGVQLFDYKDNHFRTISYRSNIDFDYLEVPVLLNFYFLKNFYASIGLEFGYRFDERAKLTDIVTWNDQSFYVAKSAGFSEYSENILPDEDDRLNYSGILGINYSLNNKLDIGLRYGVGLNKIMNVDWVDEYGFSSLHESEIYTEYLQAILRVKLK
ncbi:MAG: porin family protein [Paludibacter sp.]|nr:porin family protein [Paludibacter sp.]